jgi:hypothetical protein
MPRSRLRKENKFTVAGNAGIMEHWNKGKMERKEWNNGTVG